MTDTTTRTPVDLDDVDYDGPWDADQAIADGQGLDALREAARAYAAASEAYDQAAARQDAAGQELDDARQAYVAAGDALDREVDRLHEAARAAGVVL